MTESAASPDAYLSVGDVSGKLGPCGSLQDFPGVSFSQKSLLLLTFRETLGIL